MILNIAEIIDESLENIESRFGTATIIQPRGIGGSEDIPHGGETREYQFGRYTLAMNFDKQHIARGIVIEGWTESGYRIDQWPVVLAELGMTVLMKPDNLAPAAAIWRNYQGYGILVGLNKSYGVVAMVRVYKIP